MQVTGCPGLLLTLVFLKRSSFSLLLMYRVSDPVGFKISYAFCCGDMHFDAFYLLFYPAFTVVYSLSLQDQLKNTSQFVELTDKVLSAVHQWAPNIWIHPEERFFPTGVKDFLKEVFLKRLNCSYCTYRANKLPKGPRSTNYHLTTITDRDVLLWNQTSILYGSNVTTKNVPVYAFVSTCDSSYQKFIVTYWFFYPFNEGKEMCSVSLGNSKALPVPKLFKKCLGKTLTYGSHIGDWEHMSLEIKNFVPSRMFLSVHNIGVYYKYRQATNEFLISSGRTQGLSMVQNPPSIVKVVEGHPVLFSAQGSHGLWGTAGAFKYTKLSLSQLVDKTGYGVSWKTWNEVQVFFPSNTPDWYHFQGRWGNARDGCLNLNQLFSSNVCLFSDGPKGLSQRMADFRCN